MHKSEVGFYGIFMNGGNPCFVYNDGRVSKYTVHYGYEGYKNSK